MPERLRLTNGRGKFWCCTGKTHSLKAVPLRRWARNRQRRWSWRGC